MLLALILSTFVVFCKGQTVLPPPSSVTLGKFEYEGTGCPPNSVSRSFNNEKTAFILLFNQYTASIGPGVYFENHKSCSLGMVINVPSGYQYSLTNVDYKWTAKLAGGVTATQTSIFYFFTGLWSTWMTSKVTVFRGPKFSTALSQNSFTTPVITKTYSPCNAKGLETTLNLLIKLDLTSQSVLRAGSITNVRIPGQLRDKVYMRYALTWRRC